MTNYTTTSLATQFHLDLTKNFHTLTNAEVCRVIEAADLVKYRKPKHANGSRGRYFFNYLKRASRKA